MPKRMIDFDALWASDKLATCAESGPGGIRLALWPRGRVGQLRDDQTAA